MPARAHIGLGSNMGDARANVEAAVRALGVVGAVLARSSFYRSAPWGVREQAEFINAAVTLETALEPLDLLDALQRIERELGRVKTYRWGPRVIDLDILAYGDLTLKSPRLTLPHAYLLERAFVLAPLAEISEEYRAPYERLAPEAKAEVTRL